jgi:hypothetical protein
MIHYVVPQREDYTIREYLEFWGREVAGRISVVHYEDLPARRDLPAGTWVFSALDHLTPAGRALAAGLAERLEKVGPDVKVLNSPGRALLRFELLELLHRLGLNPHRAARAGGDLSGLRYPVFVRDERWHTGALSPLLHTPAELSAALGRCIVRGHHLDDLLAVEFTDTADSGGTFRKYAAYAVGSAIIPRSLEMGRQWMIKLQVSEHSESGYLEQRAYVFENPHEDALRPILKAAGVEYGRIDYSIKDGAPVTWEINLNPTIGRGLNTGALRITPALRALREETKEHFYARFRSAWDGVDIAQSPRAITLPEHPPMTGPMTYVENPYRFGAARRALRPARAWIDRLAGAVSPLLIRASRAGRSRARARSSSP